jgi:tetratricopeptide (TPR) repeat protein
VSGSLGRATAALVLCLGLRVGSLPVRADDLPAPAAERESSEYRELVDEAVREYQLRNFAEARTLFARAHALSPSARTLRGLGASEFELRNYGDSVAYLEQALASTERPLEGELRQRTERLLERGRGFVGRVLLTVTPSSVTLSVDGMTVEPSPQVLLGVGEHVLEFNAPTYRPEQRRLRVNGGDTISVRVELSQLAELLSERRSVRHDAQQRRRRWLWVSGGTLLAAALTVAAVSLARRDGDVAPPSGGTTGMVLPR